jgi:DNA-binding beta-propeller fold protein YncE
MRSLLIVPLLALGACVKDKPNVAASPAVIASGKAVYVTSEGNFGSSNAAISQFDPATGNVTDDAYRQVNGTNLGDVAQSMSFVNGSYYIVANGSGKIIRCDGSLLRTAELALPSPRYLIGVTPSKAYVSDYQSGEIAVIDLPSFKKVNSIRCPGWTEQMLMLFDKVYVTNISRSYVYVIDARQDAITDSIFVGEGAASIVSDKDDNVWVLASGPFSGTGHGSLTKIHGSDQKKMMSLDFAAGTSPRFLCRNPSGDMICFVSSDLFRMSVTSTALPTETFISTKGKTVYGLGINPGSGEIFLSDALDYSQRSNIYRYRSDGSLIGYFKAGINSGGFCFE